MASLTYSVKLALLYWLMVREQGPMPPPFGGTCDANAHKCGVLCGRCGVAVWHGRMALINLMKDLGLPDGLGDDRLADVVIPMLEELARTE